METLDASTPPAGRALPRLHEQTHGPDTAEARPVLEAVTATFANPLYKVEVKCDPALRLPANQLGPVGGIVREAVANALRHAFPAGRAGQVWVDLKRDQDRMDLRIRDNGPGIPDQDAAPDSGRGRIHAMAHELGGYARLGSLQFGGGEVRVVFPA